MPTEFDSANWYAVRCIVRSDRPTPSGARRRPSGWTSYEERITLWRAASFHAAIASAEAESAEYAADLGYEVVEGFAQAYRVPDEPGHGIEVFSLIRDSPLEPDAYLDRFFDAGGERQRHLE